MLPKDQSLTRVSIVLVKLQRVQWVPVIVLAENLLAILVLAIWPDRWPLSILLLASGLCLTILEGVRIVIESSRARTRNAAANPVGRRG